MTEGHPANSRFDSTHPAWQIARLICFAIILLSVISCVVIAAIRSNGLTQVTVTVLDPEIEPRDPIVPFMNPQEALPDYELVVIDSSGHKTNLGTRPNTSAVHGLSWQLNEPASVSEIVGLRLQDQDKVISDVITEVQVTSDTAAADGYRFDFQTEYSLSVGIQSFFRTPIGKTISAAFFVAMLIIIFSVFMV
ncbi:hypothetical protein [uncultured Rubinisphaera sp.]|uniref:hypothetical protein n=1 Tax=uncultured Rubinisphaera sp. TaxID=1678686 RepID=UPI0030D8D005